MTSRLLDRLGFPLMLFVVSRLALAGLSASALAMSPTLYVAAPGPLANYPALAGLCRWDCGWFYQIATEGYTDWTHTNFWPLYPMAARVLAYTGLSVQFSLLVVSNACGLAAWVVIYRLFENLEGRRSAQCALTLLAVYPFAYFQAAGYPESMSMLFGSLTISFAMEARLIPAGLALGTGILARHVTVFTGAGVLVAHLRANYRNPRRLFFSWDALGVTLPLFFVAGYSFYCWRAFQRPLAFVHARAAWGEGAWYGATSLWESGDVIDNLYLLFAMVPLVGSVMLLTRKRWAELAGPAVCMMAVFVAIGAWGLGRYSASCWPAFLPLGVWLSRRRNLQLPVIVGFALFQGMLFSFWARQFKIL